jgi:2-phospho-L-lactate guanylyltransferase
MNVWAIVPVEPFASSKTWLKNYLDAAQAVVLAEVTFRHTLEILHSLRSIDQTMVVSRDHALALARESGARTLHVGADTDLNVALRQAGFAARAQGAQGALVLPADVPLVTPTDLEQMIHMGRYSGTVVISPDQSGTGTTALFVAPPGLIPFAYGPDSFARHCTQARTVGAEVKVYHSSHLALDIGLSSHNPAHPLAGSRYISRRSTPL